MRGIAEPRLGVRLLQRHGAPRPREADHLGHRRRRIREVQQQGPLVHEVERAGRQACPRCVGPDELDVVVAAELRGHREQPRLELQADNPPPRADTPSELREDAEDAAADVDDARARADPDAVEQCLGLGRVDLGLRDEVLHFGRAVSQPVSGGHRPSLTRRRRARYREKPCSCRAARASVGSLMIGRERELAVIDRRLRDLRGPSVLAVTGEPGIGKTRLLEELAERARAHGCAVLRGRALEFESAVPYAPFADALDGEIDARTVARLGEEPLAELARILPSLVERPAPRLATERYRLHRATRTLLGELARRRPLILAL